MHCRKATAIQEYKNPPNKTIDNGVVDCLLQFLIEKVEPFYVSPNIGATDTGIK